MDQPNSDASALGADLEGTEGSNNRVHKAPAHQLSCDYCRRRKIRCDRQNPCGACSRKQIQCTYPFGIKQRVKRQRALVSDGYESKLEEISDKLDRICLALDNLDASPLPRGAGDSTAASSRGVGQGRSAPRTLTPLGTGSSEYGDGTTPPSRVEEEPALMEDAAFATSFAEQAVDTTNALQALPEVKSSLNALRRALEVRGDEPDPSPPAGVDCRPALCKPDLPPIQLAMSALQKVRGAFTRPCYPFPQVLCTNVGRRNCRVLQNPEVTEDKLLTFFWSMEFESINDFFEYLMTVYSGKPTLADLIIVLCGLHRILPQIASLESDDATREELESQTLLCRTSLECVLSRLPFHLPVTFDYALALYMASSYYLSRCRVTSAWRCITAASEICITLGFHRLLSGHGQAVAATRGHHARKIRLFWSLYIVERTLTLKLNRPSMLCDMKLSFTDEQMEAIFGDVIYGIVPKWTEFACLQGRVYDEIYSPAALEESDAVRGAKARTLARELERILLSTSPLEEQFLAYQRKALGETTYELFINADQIYYFSILTLVCRAIPVEPGAKSAFSNECLAAAKACLEEHKKCVSMLRAAKAPILEVFIQWSIMSSPFTPFIIMFCHAIETGDSSHIEHLASVIETLRMLPTDIPEVFRRQLHVFTLMYDVASKSTMRPVARPLGRAVGRIPDTPFEMLLAEAGLPTEGVPSWEGGRGNSHEGFADGAGAGVPTRVQGGEGPDWEMDMGNELGDWFDQNCQIFKMIEDAF